MVANMRPIAGSCVQQAHCVDLAHPLGHLFGREPRDGSRLVGGLLGSAGGLAAEDQGDAATRHDDLRHSTATLLLEQGVELVVIKELLGHAHIGVIATVYADVRLRLQRDAIDALGSIANDESTRDAGENPPPCGATVR
jgi:hypothetical protein